ncbi:LOW QUALITY PROTEIN: maestro heat-like repeat family member 5 [Glossophaga mutica]
MVPAASSLFTPPEGLQQQSAVTRAQAGVPGLPSSPRSPCSTAPAHTEPRLRRCPARNAWRLVARCRGTDGPDRAAYDAPWLAQGFSGRESQPSLGALRPRPHLNMDRKRSEKAGSHSTAASVSSALSQNPRSASQARACGSPGGDPDAPLPTGALASPSLGREPPSDTALAGTGGGRGISRGPGEPGSSSESRRELEAGCSALHPSLPSTYVRISSHISESLRDLSCRKAPPSSARRDRAAHPSTILLCKSQSSQAALAPREHRAFLEKACSAAICFKMLRDLSGSDPSHLSYIVKKIKTMAHEAPSLVLETIHEYFVDNPEVSSWHKLRLFHVLETVIGVSDSLEESWEKAFIKLALENMAKSTELKEAYQDAAGNLLVAVCRHSWRQVAQHLETKVLTGVFPHRSLLYVMGILTSQQGPLSQADRANWEEQLNKIAARSAPFLNSDVWSKELLWALTKPDQTPQEQPPEKAFLFVFYGLILQAEDNGATVRKHLQTLLETSHRWPKQREGMAVTAGLAAARHLEDVWAVLEHFGQSDPIKCSLHSFSPKASEDLRWKWASSTILLAYGQMAVKAKAHILPWVDSISSRMIFFFRYSSWNETLKQSFLTAVLMLVEAVGGTSGAQSYRFSQLSELLECLMVLLQKEPKDALYTPARQQAICVISSLCKLSPPLDLEKKSQLLSICLHSVLDLPLLDVLERHTCLFLEPPNIQTLYDKTSEALDQLLQTFLRENPTTEELHFLLSHLFTWLASDKAHERQRAVNSCVGLLKFLSLNLRLDPKEDFKRVGQLVAMLGVLCQDPDRATQGSSVEGLGQLYQLLMRQRDPSPSVFHTHHCPTPPRPAGASQVDTLVPERPQASMDGAPLWSSGDQKAKLLTPQEVACPKDRIFQLGSSQVIKEVMKRLTLAELSDLIWTTVEGLGSTSPFRVQAAASMLLAVIQEHGAQLETVANLGRAIHLQLGSVRVPQAKEDVLFAVTLLARNHTPELVAAFLDLPTPPDSHTFQLWRALGAELPGSRRVLATLLAWLQERPPPAQTRDSGPQAEEKTHLRSMAAMTTLCKLQLTPEFKKTVQKAYPQLLLAFLTQVHYILELHLPREPRPSQKAQGAAVPSPQSLSLEALRSLLATTGHWKSFAQLELQGAWSLFAAVDTYPKGVGLLARAMVQGVCEQVKDMARQLLHSLRSQEEQERKVAILILNEFLHSPALLEVLSEQDALTLLAQSLRDPSPEVRALSLQGLGSILFHPEKGSLLRRQLPHFLNGFFRNSEPVVVHLMGTVSEVLHRLGAQGAGAQSLAVAINARSFFNDEREGVRAAAMALFGDLVAAMAGKEPRNLRTQVQQSMVPLLLHLKDRCPAVVTQAKFAFYRCSLLLRWRLPHTLFCTLAWERGLSARHFLWSRLLTQRQELFSIHLSQALSYLHSRHHHLKTWAALFLGYATCYHPQAVSRVASSGDVKLLFCSEQPPPAPLWDGPPPRPRKLWVGTQVASVASPIGCTLEASGRAGLFHSGDGASPSGKRRLREDEPGSGEGHILLAGGRALRSQAPGT